MPSKRPTHGARVHLARLHDVAQGILADRAGLPSDSAANSALVLVHLCGVMLAGIASGEAPALVQRQAPPSAARE